MKNNADNKLEQFEAFLADIDNQSKEETLAELASQGIQTQEFLVQVQKIVEDGHKKRLSEITEKEHAGGSILPDQAFAIRETRKENGQKPPAFGGAFGRFVQLMRRRCKLTVEQLARKASIDTSEVVSMERDSGYFPEPSAVHRVAGVFQVSPNRLMQLAGLAEARDEVFIQEAVRFAASSQPIEKLSAEEKEALEHFIAVLNAQCPPAKKKK